MLEQVKKSLRKTSDALNDDIQSSIRAALLDMRRVGIDTCRVKPGDADTYDDLILACVEFYCKWIYNFADQAEIWRSAYERLRDSMALCGDYR